MTIAVGATVARRPFEWTRTIILDSLWAGCAAFVPLAVIATIAVEAFPHARGIGFFPELRYALVTPACAVSAVGAAFLYQFLKRRSMRPRFVLSSFLLGLGLIVLSLMGIAGPTGLMKAALPAVLGVAITLALLIPRLASRPLRRSGKAVTMLFAALWMVGVVVALAGERVAPPGADGMAFDVPRTLFDVDHRFIDLPGGTRIHYVDEGTGPTLLFLHGNPGWSFQWRDLIGGLRGSFRCVALDYPGFGLSTAPSGYGFTPREQSRVLEEFVDRLRLHDITLVMHDWGGPIGLGLAGRRPELIRALVLGDTWAWPTSPSEPRGGFSKIVGGPVGEFVQVNFDAFAWLALKQGLARNLPTDVAEVYVRPFRPLNRRGILIFYPAQILGAADYLEEVEMGLSRVGDRRALIFWGLRDPGFPRPDLLRFEKAFANHKTIELPTADHFLFEEAGEQMVREIRIFVAGEAQDNSVLRRPTEVSRHDRHSTPSFRN